MMAHVSLADSPMTKGEMKRASQYIDMPPIPAFRQGQGQGLKGEKRSAGPTPNLTTAMIQEAKKCIEEFLELPIDAIQNPHSIACKSRRHRINSAITDAHRAWKWLEEKGQEYILSFYACCRHNSSDPFSVREHLIRYFESLEKEQHLNLLRGDS